MSEASEMAARLPPIAWVMPNDRCRDDGSLDAMAWQEGEFSTPLCSQAEAADLIDRQTAEIEALRAALAAAEGALEAAVIDLPILCRARGLSRLFPAS